jgi:hypothetical protein
MRKSMALIAALGLLGLVEGAAPREAPGGKDGLNDEGFITTWLLLAPIPLKDGQSGADALGEQQVKDEAKLQPKAGDKVKAAGKELAWKEWKCKDWFIDFNDYCGGQTEDAVAYAVCYIHSDKELKNIKMLTGSDDQAMVYLNGKQVLKQDQARSHDKDQDTTMVTLNKGANVLVFKVINEKIDWQGSVRFTDADNNVIRSIKVTTAPK